MSYDALDDFAGPGGWDVGARMVGLTTVGIEWDMAACLTAKAAGHARIRADVAAYPSEPFTGVPGYIASPPCQAWAMGGDRKGEADRANCHALADRMAAGDDSTDWTEWEDERSPLVCQPVRRVRELRPEWVALEEVPAVLGLWEHFSRIFRGWGYSVWVGVLNAADYGVPQTRQRAILMASRLDVVTPPVPTHSRDGDEGDLFGARREAWVGIADVLPERRCHIQHELTGAGFAERRGYRLQRSGATPSFTIRAWHSSRLFWLREDGEREHLSTSEMAVLQSFPADYPVHGAKTRADTQIGNAVPPLLAAHVLAALTGKALEAAA